jgi:hypothetical protein
VAFLALIKLVFKIKNSSQKQGFFYLFSADATIFSKKIFCPQKVGKTSLKSCS